MEDKKNILPKWIKEHLSDFVRFLRNFSCNILYKTTGNKCEDHKRSTILIALVFIYFFSSGLLTNSVKLVELIFGKIIQEQTKQTASVASVLSSGVKVDFPNETSSVETKNCDLANGKWARWYGNITRDYEDDNYFILPANSSGALFRYHGEIKSLSNCEFTFIPRGEKSINYVISLDGIYQIVIGDNDMWTVTLKSTDRVEGDLVPLKESNLDITRPRLNSKIKNGTKVKVLLRQEFTDNNKYEVVAEITYKNDTSESNFETETFTWRFDPSPAISEFPNLSFGLIRAKGDDSEISANFIYPKVDNVEVQE